MRTRLCAMAVFCLVAGARGDGSEAAVVKMTFRGGQCSAVCVDPSGILVTVKHCCQEPTAVFHFRSHPAVEGRRIYVGPAADDAAVYAVPGDGWPFAPLADGPPKFGADVWAAGYPAGEFATGRGTITSVGTIAGQRVNIASFPTHPGWSGGPLFNAAGEVIGIASHADERTSLYVSWTDTAAAVRTARATLAETPAAKPDLIVFGTDDCARCRQFEGDQAHFARAWNVRIVKYRTVEGRGSWFERIGGEWVASTLAQEFTAATGKKLASVPVFWIPSREAHVVGYTGKAGLIGWLERLFAGVSVAVTGKNPLASPLPSPAVPEVDWSHVKIVVAVPELLDGTLGLLAGVAERRAVGPLRRAVAEQTGGKAALDVVFQRLEPERYAAFIAAAGLGDQVAVTVLVREHNQFGVLRDLILAKVAAAVERRLERAPIEVLFERTHPADFAAIEQALATVGTTPFVRETDDLPQEREGLVDEVKGVILGEVKERLVEAVEARLVRPNEGDAEPPPEKGLLNEATRDGFSIGTLLSLISLVAMRVFRKAPGPPLPGEPR